MPAKSRDEIISAFHLFKLGCLHPVACIRSGSAVSVQRNSVSVVVYYFIQIIRYMFRSYDHLQAEIYTVVLISTRRWSYDRNMERVI
jgi:hypothetical protein